MKPTRSRPMQRRTGLLLILIVLPLVAMLSTATNASAQVCGDVILTSQAQVDAVSCSSVAGTLRIGLGVPTDIMDLSPLSSVASVGGTLDISSNPVLMDLTGLGGIVSVGGNLNIFNNTGLETLDGLAGVTSVGGNLLVLNNTVLTEFCGLFPLLDANGLVGFYDVAVNATNPTEVEILAGGPCPVVCASLNLTTQAEVNAASCSSVTGDLRINGPDITDLSPLSSVNSVGGNLFIFNNPVLTNVDGLAGITSVGGNLTIQNNDVLPNLDGLAALTSVGIDLVITFNDVLTNLDGLAALTSVGGVLSIQLNPVLMDLTGLGGITSVGGGLTIQNNDVLSEFCGLFPLLDAGGLVGNYTVTGNATNPTEAEILAGGACVVPPVPALGLLGIAILLTLLGATAYWQLRDSTAV